MKYRVVSEGSELRLREEVETYMSMDWELQGGVSVVYHSVPGWRFSQAMFLKEKPDVLLKMGQAKNRGSFESRCAQSIERKKVEAEAWRQRDLAYEASLTPEEKKARLKHRMFMTALEAMFQSDMPGMYRQGLDEVKEIFYDR